MPINDRSFVRLPPDGAGKYVSASHTIHVDYSSATNQQYILDGLEFASQDSSLHGTIAKHTPVTATSGSLVLVLHPEHEFSNFTVGETVFVYREDAIIPTFQIVSQTTLQTNKTQLVSIDNPFYGQRVDAMGAANVRFAEGSVQFDAFGALQVTGHTSLGAYVPEYDGLDSLFNNIIDGNATGLYNSAKGAYILRCTTSSGDRILRSSNKYHQYHPGVSQLIKITGASGDSGKDGVVRRWGYFDTSNGVFFELYEHTLNVVLRRNMGDGLEEIRIPQSNWNTDKGDGTGLSRVNIDVSKNNIWWIDLAWLGAGRVRFGMFAPDGTRVTLHTLENSNRYNYSYMRTGTLPVAFEQINISGAASTSEFIINSSVVTQENTPAHIHYFFGTELASATSITGSNYIHIGSIRSSQTFKGKDNRMLILPHAMNFSALDGSGNEQNIRVALAFNASLTSPTWSPHQDTESGAEFCPGTVDTLAGADRVVYVGITYPGKTLELEQLFPYSGNQFVSHQLNGYQSYVGVYVKPVRPTDSLDVYGDMIWKEYR